jgi:UDP-2,3-diacylglucosamine hydrolase
LEKINLKGSDLVVISDVHIRHVSDAHYDVLLRALESIRERAKQKKQTLLLLGDVFDFYLGRGAFFRKKFAGFGDEIKKLRDSGVDVLFVEGNHEFAMADSDWGFTKTGDKDLLIDVDGKKTIAVCHGDLLGAPSKYRWFRKLIKSKIIIFIASLVPGKFLDWYALGQASYSRSFDAYRSLDHGRIIGAAKTWLDTCGATHGVFGHFHVPYAEDYKQSNTPRIFSLDSWQKPNMLIFSDDNIFRRFWDEKKGDFVDRPLTSVLNSSN